MTPVEGEAHGRWQEVRERVALAWHIATGSDGALVQFARAEAARVDTDVVDHFTNMARVFALEGHSGGSAPWAIRALRRVLAFEPLSPLTGEASEWMEVGDGMWQNRRCSRVFKGRDGVAYDSEGRVFCDPDGCTYLSRDSRVHVTFPYTPHTEHVNVPAESDV